MPPPPRLHDVAAVVVSYRPDVASLAALLAALAEQVGSVIVVDNASPEAPAVPSGVRLVRLPVNQGVGAAQNAGIRMALQGGAAQVLLLDQDSLPAPDMVVELLAAGAAAAAAGLRIGAVGPLVVDARGEAPGFVHVDHGRYEHRQAPADRAWVTCDLLIASGTLLTPAVLADVGTMDEDLFIDRVDTDWCLRAVAAGYALIGAARARLQHRIGDGEVASKGLNRRSVHAPFRHYYMVRNSLLLRRKPHAHAAWRRADCRQLFGDLLVFGLCGPDRLQVMKMMMRGLMAGLRGEAGPLR